jgi:hypothetical protein
MMGNARRVPPGVATTTRTNAGPPPEARQAAASVEIFTAAHDGFEQKNRKDCLQSTLATVLLDSIFCCQYRIPI